MSINKTDKKTIDQNGVSGNKLHMRLGMYNESFKMTEVKFSKKEIVNIGGYNAEFIISAGPLQKAGNLPNLLTYMLEIHYYDGLKERFSKLPMGGFNSNLGDRYTMAAHELALQTIKERGWTLDLHLNSFPEFQAMVSLDREKVLEELKKKTSRDITVTTTKKEAE